MTRILGLAVVAMLAVGCATSGSVKEQVAPLSDRLSNVEAKLADLNKKVDAQSTDVQALRKDVADSNAAAQKAQQAAQDAENAANRAETASAKAAKAFELRQMKGKK